MGLFMCAFLLFIGAGASSTPTTTDKIAELFSQIENDGSHKEQSDIINNDYNSVLCWLETINSVEYRNGTRSVDRQFSIILETPGDLSNTSLDAGEAVFNGSTKKSKTLNFTSTYQAKNFTVRINKTLLCGAGRVIIKEFIKWPSGKKRIQIDVGSKKMLENHELKKCGDLPNCKFNKVVDVNKTNPVSKNKRKGPNETEENRVGGVNEETPEIFNSIKETKKLKVGNSVRVQTEDPCDLQHKLNMTFQISIQHIIIKTSTGEVIQTSPILEAVKGQVFNMTQRRVHKTPNPDDVNKTWERLVRLLSREYFIECCHKIIPYSELPMPKSNATISGGNALILFDEEARARLASAHKQMQKCRNKLV